MSPKKKRSSKEDKTVQTTLVEDAEKKTSSKREAKKKVSGKKAPKKTATSKKTESKKTKPKAKKESKKTTKKEAPKKSKKKPKKKAPEVSKDTIVELTSIPGVGGKLAERLAKAGYDSMERIARARASSISKKVDGISSDGAKKLVSAAKEAMMMADAPETEPAEVGEAETKMNLKDVPGVGDKLAKSLTSAGYDSVERLSRARPDSISKKVDGVSDVTAQKIVDAAKEMVKAREAELVVGRPEPVVVAPKEAEEKEVKEEIPEEAPEKPKEKKKTEKKAAKKKPAPKTRKKPLPPPKKKKPKVIRKESGLPVPKAVDTLAKDLRKQWSEAGQEAKRKEAEEGGEALPETVEVVSLSADDTSERLVDVAIEVLQETMMTGRPAFEIPSRSGDNIVWDEVRDLLLLGMRTISRPYHSLASVVDATRTARVMEIVFELLNSNLHATKREVYYSDVNLFRDQKYSDKIIEDVASMLQTTRDSIHVVASARGSAMGRVVIRDGGDLIDLTKMGTGGWAVTPFLDQLEIVESDAEFIILSEKDAAVMRLAEAKYWNRQPCIVITGKGSGDIATRAFLKMLVKELEIPAFALVDSDPYGHYIYSVFLRGSKRLSYESPFIATPELKLLGVLSRDLDQYNIPKSVRIPMQPTDIKRVRDMLKEPFVKRNKPWVEDLRLMLNMREKAEIQSFASHSFEYLTDEYLPTKLETGDWI